MTKHNIGIYPPAQNTSIKNKDVGKLLSQIGYNTNDLDKALLAFERRFMPELIATDNNIRYLEENLQTQKPILKQKLLLINIKLKLKIQKLFMKLLIT